MNLKQLRRLAGLKESIDFPGEEMDDQLPVAEPMDAEVNAEPMGAEMGAEPTGAEMGAEPAVPMDAPGMENPGSTTIPELTDVAPTSGTNPPSELVLVLLNKQLSQYLSAMGINIEQSDAGSKALVPVDAKDTYTSAFSDMGYDDTDYRFEEEADLDNGYSDVRDQDDLGAHGDRWFPDGETSTPRNQARMGPSGSARSGSNPMNFSTDRAFESLTKAYEKFKLEEADSKKKGPKITARKHEGDDKYSWAVFIDGRPFVTGLGQSEVAYYKKRALEEYNKKHPAEKPGA